MGIKGNGVIKLTKCVCVGTQACPVAQNQRMTLLNFAGVSAGTRRGPYFAMHSFQPDAGSCRDSGGATWGCAGRNLQRDDKLASSDKRDEAARREDRKYDKMNSQDK